VDDDNDAEQQRRDRERILELMLSKEQVVALIYAKTQAAAAAAPGSPTKTTGFGTSSSPTAAAMEGVVNGLLDLNFSSNPSWTSGAGTHDSESSSPHAAGVDGDNASHRGEFFSDKLPPLVPPGRK
jgi:hypothetical protein